MDYQWQESVEGDQGIQDFKPITEFPGFADGAMDIFPFLR